MTRHARRMLGTVAVSVLALALAGCGASGSSNGGDSEGPIKIGAINSTTGVMAPVGADYQIGWQVAVDEINKSGGVLGRKLQLITTDDAFDPAKDLAQARQLVTQDNVDALFGPIHTDGSNAVAPFVAQQKIVTFNGSSNDDLADGSKYPWFFNNQALVSVQAAAIAQGVLDGGFKKPVYIASNAPYGTTMHDAIQKYLDSKGGPKLSGTEYFTPGTVDVTSQMQKLTNLNPDVIVDIGQSATDAAAIIKARNAVAPKIPVRGGVTNASPQTLATVGSSNMEGVWAGASFKTFVGTPSEAAAAFINAVKKVKGVTTIQDDLTNAAGAYDQIKMYAAAVEATKSTDSTAIKKYLESHPYTGAKGTYTYTPAHHTGLASSEVTWALSSSFKDGVWQPPAGD